VEQSKQQVSELLQRAGPFETAEAAIRELPDPVDLEQVQEWGLRRRVTRDGLISRLGGSP
jgi:hypothetical protein